MKGNVGNGCSMLAGHQPHTQTTRRPLRPSCPPPLRFLLVTNPHIRKVYNAYYHAFEVLRAHPPVTTLTENTAFCALLRRLVDEHGAVGSQGAWPGGVWPAGGEGRGCSASRDAGTSMHAHISFPHIASGCLAPPLHVRHVLPPSSSPRPHAGCAGGGVA
jgi:hypothetical protein